jgi:hypothetical protein
MKNMEEYWSMFSSYQKKALTVMMSPLCTNCHDITVILLNVALNTINLIFYLQRHIPTYLSIYIFINNEKKIWNIWKERKLNSDKIWKVWKKNQLNSEMIWKIWKKNKLKIEIVNLNKLQAVLFCKKKILFFHIFHIFSQFSSVFSKSFLYSTCLSSVFSKITTLYVQG